VQSSSTRRISARQPPAHDSRTVFFATAIGSPWKVPKHNDRRAAGSGVFHVALYASFILPIDNELAIGARPFTSRVRAHRSYRQTV
jgi:hypothetical protein